jgi:hypothetical protein
MFHPWSSAIRPARGSPKRRRVLPAIEAQEDRTLPANLAPTIFTDSAAGTGSLRDAVITANSNGEDNAITLQGGTYALTLQNPAGFPVNDALTGDLDLTASGHTLTIQGQGPCPSPGPGPMPVHGVMPLVVKVKGHRLLKVLDAQTGALRFAVNPFGKGFQGNFFVATADVNGDGFADVLVTARLRPRHLVTRIFSGLNGARLA